DYHAVYAKDRIRSAVEVEARESEILPGGVWTIEPRIPCHHCLTVWLDDESDPVAEAGDYSPACSIACVKAAIGVVADKADTDTERTLIKDACRDYLAIRLNRNSSRIAEIGDHFAADSKAGVEIARGG